MKENSVSSLLNNAAFYADPYPFYAALRANDPVVYSDVRGGSWIFTSYEDVLAGFKDVRWSSARAGSLLAAFPKENHTELQPLVDTLSKWLLFTDPPKHTRLRKLLGKAFAQASLESLRPRIEAAVHELLDPVAPEKEMDFISDFAFQLPLLVIVELLGVSKDKRDEFIAWSGDLAQYLGGAVPTLELARRTQESALRMIDYLRGQVAFRRDRPGNDILTALIQAEEGGGSLGEDELYAQCVLFLFAGHETTRNLLGNGLYALLLETPESSSNAYQRLRDDPSLVKSAVEEALRYDSPVQMLTRVAADDFEYAGRSIRKGQRAMLFTGAANRDPAVFPEPDRFDIERRNNNRHIAFGVGPHACLGAFLASMEAQIAFSALIERMPHIRLAEQPTYVANLGLRGLRSLNVEF